MRKIAKFILIILVIAIIAFAGIFIYKYLEITGKLNFGTKQENSVTRRK